MKYSVGEQHPDYGKVIYAKRRSTILLTLVALLTGFLAVLIPRYRRAWRSWLICERGLIRKSLLKTLRISFLDVTTVQAAPRRIQLTMTDKKVHEIPSFDRINLRDHIGAAVADAFAARLDAGEKIPFGNNLLTRDGLYLTTTHKTVPYACMASMEMRGLQTEVWFKSDPFSGKIVLEWCDTNRDPGLALLRSRAVHL